MYTLLHKESIAPFCDYPIPTRTKEGGLRLRRYDVHKPALGQEWESFVALCKLLRTLHRAGVIVCDLKSEHVRQTPTGEIILIDFDQSCYMRAGTEGGGGYTPPLRVCRQSSSLLSLNP